ncbi:MAG TPA: hypothetical protein PKE69_04085 [Pyrinomonadaceae bacterium]|nr:hypothetical protein [Pyrinomonadaceae bacterium]
MKFTKFSLVVIGVIISVSIGYFIGQNTKPTSAQIENRAAESSQSCNLLDMLKKEQVNEIRILSDGNDNSFTGIIRRVNEPPFEKANSASSDKLSIYDKLGKILYETKDFGIENLQSVRLLKPHSREIMFETNGGGSDNFLKILEYKNGKFSEIIDETETQYRGGYFEMLQYRNGMSGPYFKPSQLIVIQQIGGTDESPYAAVFRVKDNKLQQVGSIKMQKLGDFIETQIAESNK